MCVNECIIGKKKTSCNTLLEKKGSLGFYIWSIGFFTQLERTFYAKKGSIMTRKNPFGTKVLYRLLFIHILHYSATFCSCTLLNCCSNLMSHFNHADFLRRKTKNGTLRVILINYIKLYKRIHFLTPISWILWHAFINTF